MTTRTTLGLSATKEDENSRSYRKERSKQRSVSEQVMGGGMCKKPINAMRWKLR